MESLPLKYIAMLLFAGIVLAAFVSITNMISTTSLSITNTTSTTMNAILTEKLGNALNVSVP